MTSPSIGLVKMWIKVLVTLFVIHTVASQTCDTENGWYLQGEDCFRVSRSAPETQYTWQEAREACLAEGGELASIHSATEQAFIVQLAINIGLAGFDLWHGMTMIDATQFRWTDGTETNYIFWAYGQPLQGGLTYCGYTETESAPTDFTRHTYTTAVYGLIYYPGDADGYNTFYFGQRYDIYDIAWCEAECERNPRCAAYSWYWYHWDYYWDHVCVGRSDYTNFLTYDSYSDSGTRSLGGGTEGWWYSTNCGIGKAFACRKDPASDTPVTIPPTSIVNSYCPAGYYSPSKHENNKCFRMVKIEDEVAGFRWDQALTLCRNGPGIDPDIASVHSEEENAFLNAQLQGYQWGYWIGYHYASRHELWVWADNTEPRYSNWQAGVAPDGTDRQCTEMTASPQLSGTWNPLSCDQRRGYICQAFKDPNTTISTPNPVTPHNCEAGWFPYWYGCYKVVAEPMTWQAANDHCGTEGAALASIHSSAENSAIFWGAENQFDVWIGLYKDVDTYKWADGWPSYYANFDNGGTSNGDGCVVMKANQKWNDTLCAQTHNFVCKKTNVTTPTTPAGGTGHCPRGNWIMWGARCYWFSDYTDTFANADLACQVQGGTTHEAHLVSIESALENNFVYSYMAGPAYYYNLWIGLRRNPSNIYEWVWVDGTPVTYTNWAPSEPNNPSEYCGEMVIDTWPGMWNDAVCGSYDYKYFACESELGPEPTYPAIPTSAPGECPSIEWYPEGTSCFLIRPNTYERWHDALEVCKYITGGRGSLATVNSVDENNFIRFVANYLLGEYSYTNLWIGFHKIGLGYPYEWEDSTPTTYTNWHAGEPNDVDGTSNCVRMYVADSLATNFGMWDDYVCGTDYENGYVCRTEQGNYADIKIPAKYQHHAKVSDNHPRNHDFHTLNHHNLHRQDFIKPLRHEMPPPDHADIHRHQPVHPVQYMDDGGEDLEIVNLGVEKDHTGQIVAITLGCIAALAVIAALVTMVEVKRRRHQTPMSFDNPVSTVQDTTKQMELQNI